MKMALKFNSEAEYRRWAKNRSVDDGEILNSSGRKQLDKRADFGIRTSPVTLTIFHRSPSWNQIYASSNWTKRKEMVDKVHADVRWTLSHQGVDAEFFRGTVDVSVVAYFDKYPLDSSNIPSKIYEDALKGYLFKDDSIKYVRWVNTLSTRSKTGRDYVEVTVSLVR